MPTPNHEATGAAHRCRSAFLALIVACATPACGQGDPSPGTGGSGASGGPSSGGSAGSGLGGTSGSGGNGTSPADASPDVPSGAAGASADARGQDTASDGFLPPDFDASDNPNCRLRVPAPVTCYVPDPPPPPSPFVECLRAPRDHADPMDYGGQLRMRQDTLYWTTFGVNGAVWQKKGAANPEVLVSMPNIVRFDVDNLAVYLSVRGDAGQTSLIRMNLDRTGLTVLVQDIGAGLFAIDEERVYFDTGDGRFVALPKGVSGSENAVPVPGPASVSQIPVEGRPLIDETHIYWNDGTAPDLTLKRVDKKTANVETLATHLPGAARLLQGDGVLLVAESRFILEVPKTGGCPKLLVSTPRGVGSLAADHGAIYWASSYPSDMANALLFRAPRSGGSIVDLFGSNQPLRGAGNLVMTPTQVFFFSERVSFSKPTIQVADRF